MKFLRSALFFVLILSLCNPAFAGGFYCKKALGPDSKKLIKQKSHKQVKEILQQEFQPTELPQVIEKLILWRVSKQIALHRKPNSKEIRQVLADKQVLLSLLNRINDPVALSWVKRELLARSLDSVALKLGLKSIEAPSVFKKLLQYKAVRFLFNPLKLPSLADRAIPAPLLEKILRDGIEVHRNEIVETFKSSHQTKVETYRQVAQAYRIVALAVVVWLVIQEMDSMQEDINNAQKEKLHEDLMSIEDFINALDDELEHRGLYN